MIIPNRPTLRPLYIFDMDGTIADMTHRVHLLDNDGPNSEKWKLFYEMCEGDAPIAPTLKTLEALRRAGNDIWFLTGRSDVVRAKSTKWIVDHTSFDEVDVVLGMRTEGDHQHDYTFKQSWYNNMLKVDQERLVCVFEDRQVVVDMWRRIGVTCFQVATGKF